MSNVAIGEYHDNFSDHLPVEVDISLCLSDTGSRHTSHNSNNLNINWSKLRKENLDAYTSTMETALDLISFWPCILHGSFLCTDNCHKYHIEEYFNHIVNAIKTADSILERTNSRALKPYWSPQLTKLKQESFSTHRAWLQADKPSSGILHDDYIHARQNYRKCLRLEKRRSSEKANDKMLDGLLNKNSVGFWRTWNSINRVKDPLPARIDGHMDDSGISNHFADVFSGIYENRDIDSHDSLRSDFYSCFNEYYNEHLFDHIGHYYFSWNDMVDMISHLKSGKSYVGFIRAEHILKGSPKLLTHLHILFNAMLQHSFIPTLMLRGTITPLVKDRDGDLSASTNYRPITLSLIFIQMYEMLKKAKFGYFLPKSELQFGFRSGISTSHAIFTLCRKELPSFSCFFRLLESI